MDTYRHICVSVIVVCLFSIILWCFLLPEKVELFSALIVIVLAVAGFIYQSGENSRLQNLQYRRENYAALMESLAIFKRSGDKTQEDKKLLTEKYFRSWVETSDKVYQNLLQYFKAYLAWSADKNSETVKTEKNCFDILTRQIKMEISGKAGIKFEDFYFK